MTKTSNLPEFDAVDYLDSEEAITTYLNTIREEHDAELLAEAKKDVVRARIAMTVKNNSSYNLDELLAEHEATPQLSEDEE